MNLTCGRLPQLRKVLRVSGRFTRVHHRAAIAVPRVVAARERSPHAQGQRKEQQQRTTAKHNSKEQQQRTTAINNSKA
eukprot:3604758-Pyramimonas_sp.AAC.1